jgi:hypothetical protein
VIESGNINAAVIAAHVHLSAQRIKRRMGLKKMPSTLVKPARKSLTAPTGIGIHTTLFRAVPELVPAD